MKLKVNGIVYQAKESATSLIGDIQVLGNRNYRPKRRNCVRVDFDNENQFALINWQDFSEWSIIIGDDNEFNQSKYCIICKTETNLFDNSFSVWLGEMTNEELLEAMINDLMEV